VKRNGETPRANWQQIVESQGLEFHTPVGDSGLPETYWNESASYSFTAEEADAIERAAGDCFQLCLEAVQHVIDDDRFAELAIPSEVIPSIVRAWNAEPPSLYGRFDFSMQDGMPKMLELNADTPTSLLEAAVIQWEWKQAKYPALDQFNSIHEHLVAKWKDVRPYLRENLLHLAAGPDIEDQWTIAYLAFTARDAGLETNQLLVGDIGWNEHAAEFRDMAEREIQTCFKLYPWEWFVCEEIWHQIQRAETMWIEPIWKMVLSNKGILPILWELNPEHPNLLEAQFDAPSEKMWGWAKKPLLSREGANVTLKSSESFVHASPDLGYGEEGYVFQSLAPLPEFDGNHAVIGAWVVDGEACGMGVRESDGPITGNRSRFVPHFIE
jgi:glutathionylspermidine synthase